MEPYRILHSIESVTSGGVEVRRLSLVRRLRAPDFEHLVICTHARGPMAQSFRDQGVSLIEVGRVASVFNTRRFRIAADIVRQWQPDIIHGAIIEGYTLASIVGRWKRVPVVLMEETSDPQNRHWRGHVLARTMAGLADHCIGVSESVGHYLTGTLRIPRTKVSVINNGVEMPEVPTKVEQAMLRKQLGIEDHDLVVGSVGRMADDTKRFGDLIRAFANLNVSQNSKLILVGDGPIRPGLEILASELGITNRVIFCGFQSKVGHFYSLMDVFALTSERESFGLVNAEAMRCSLPVVATRVGGIPDVVADGVTGILVSPRDIGGITQALRKLLTDVKLRNEFGTAGKSRADRLFTSERYVTDVRSLYEQLLSKKLRKCRV